MITQSSWCLLKVSVKQSDLTLATWKSNFRTLKLTHGFILSDHTIQRLKKTQPNNPFPNKYGAYFWKCHYRKSFRSSSNFCVYLYCNFSITITYYNSQDLLLSEKVKKSTAWIYLPVMLTKLKLPLCQNPLFRLTIGEEQKSYY